jgi:flagellar motor protein MotB
VPRLPSSRLAQINTRLVFWPCMVDMLTSVLMIFLLIYFIQATLGHKDLEAELVRKNQQTFADGFRRQFSKEIAGRTVAVEQGLNLIQITFSDKILFPQGEYELQQAGKDVLRRCATIFNRSTQSGFKQIQVEGHTDDVGFNISSYPRDNWELSTGRAISVVKFLVENGLDDDLLSANGYADNRPRDPRDTKEARDLNRRIEIRVIFSTPGEQR